MRVRSIRATIEPDVPEVIDSETVKIVFDAPTPYPYAALEAGEADYAWNLQIEPMN